MTRQDITVIADDGKPLHVIGWVPDEPVGVVQIVHGVAEHVERYAHVAELLGRDGLAVWANDHRGHGATDRPTDYGYVARSGGWDLMIADLQAVDAHIRLAHPGLPRAIFGHSMGSILVQDLLSRTPAAYDAVVLSGSQLGGSPLQYAGWVLANVEKRRQGARGVSPALRALSFSAWNKKFAPTSTDYDWISRDPDAVAAYAADPACGFDPSNALWCDLVAASIKAGSRDAVTRLAKDLPILVITGEEDASNDNGKLARQLAARYVECGLTDVTYRSYPGARHELVNETNRDEVLADLRTWLGDHLRARSDTI